jgi:hypothetical protein
MTALEQIAALRAMMGEPAEIDAKKSCTTSSPHRGGRHDPASNAFPRAIPDFIAWLYTLFRAARLVRFQCYSVQYGGLRE